MSLRRGKGEKKKKMGRMKNTKACGTGRICLACALFSPSLSAPALTTEGREEARGKKEEKEKREERDGRRAFLSTSPLKVTPFPTSIVFRMSGERE